MLKQTKKLLKKKYNLRVGLHNGVEVNLVVKPSSPNTGIVLKGLM